MITRQRDINSTEQAINKLKDGLTFVKLQREDYVCIATSALANIDRLKSEINRIELEIISSKEDREISRPIIKKCQKSIISNTKTLNDLREKLKEMKGIEKTTKPWEKERPNNEQQICEWTGK